MTDRKMSSGKRKWTLQEDRTLETKIRSMHDGELPPASDIHWSRMKTLLPHRTPLQLRERYVHALAPTVVRGRMSKSEMFKVLQYQKTYGNKWTQIAAYIPGRTSLHVKNAFYSSLRRFKREYNRPPFNTDEMIDHYRQLVLSTKQQTRSKSLRYTDLDEQLTRTNESSPIIDEETLAPIKLASISLLSEPSMTCVTGWNTEPKDSFPLNDDIVATSTSFDPSPMSSEYTPEKTEDCPFQRVDDVCDLWKNQEKLCPLWMLSDDEWELGPVLSFFTLSEDK